MKMRYELGTILIAVFIWGASVLPEAFGQVIGKMVNAYGVEMARLAAIAQP